MSPGFPGGTVDIWVQGNWTTQLLDVSLHANTTNEWGRLTWTEENTTDEAKAYVRVVVYADNGTTILLNEIAGTPEGDTNSNKYLDLSLYPSIKGVDIYIKFNLYSKKEGPIVSDVHLT